MRTLLALLAALAVCAIALLLLDTSTPTADPGSGRSSGSSGAEQRAATAPLDQDGGRDVGREEVGEVGPTAGADGPPEPAAEGICILIGRVVDPAGAPIADALAQLIASRAWNDAGAGEPITEIAGTTTDRVRGFEVRTDDAGVFRFEVPRPDEGVTLHIVADRFRDRFSARFSDQDPARNLAPLESGLRDLGEITLADAGAVFGRVVTEDGAPLEGARIGLGSRPSAAFGRHAESDARGDFTVAHAAPGTYSVGASLDGYMNATVDGVEIRTGADVGPIEVVMERAGTISGTVVDGRRAPVAGAEVVGFPVQDGSGFRVETDDEGGFVAALPSPGPYTLRVSHDDFMTWGDENDRTKSYAPGTEGLLINLEARGKVRFVVVAAETGEPIEQFGIRVYEGEGSKTFNGGTTSRRLPRLGEQTGGARSLYASEHADAVLVWAEDRLHADTDVVLDDPNGETMTIALERGATTIGRLVLDGEGVADAPVEAVLVTAGGYEREVMRRTSTTDETGRFRIAGLGEGTHRFRALTPDRPPVVIDGLALTPPEILDLGDIDVVGGGAIEGIVHVPAGVDPAGLTVRIIKNDARPSATTDASGRFAFDELSTGEHELIMWGRSGELARALPVTCAVADGEATIVEIDATDCALVPVALTVLIDGEPAAGSSVFLSAVERPASASTSLFAQDHFRASLGSANGSGIVTGHVRAFGEATLRLTHPQLGGLGHPTARFDLRAGQPVEETVRFELASAELRLPETPELPAEGRITVWLTSSEDPSEVQYIQLGVEDGALSASDHASLEGATLRLSGLSPGNRSVELTASKKDAPQASVELPGDGTRYGPEAMWSYSGTATLVAGETARVELD